MKKIKLVLCFIFFWLQYSFWFGKHGVYDFFCIKNSVRIQECNNLRVKLKFSNNQLFYDIQDLINHPEESIEERARNELGMIKVGEVFYVLVNVN